jgi:threonine/homoserine/homoserine lactone efflux protein
MPGPAVLFIVSRSVEQGTKSGIVSVLGITVGGFVHVLFAVLGLSAILAASSLAFMSVKYAMLVLGLIFISLALVTDSIYALMAGQIAAKVRGNSTLPGIGKWISGLTYLSLGIAAAFGGSSKPQAS